MKEKQIHVLEVLDCYYPKFDGPNMVITSYANSYTKSGKCQVEAVVPSAASVASSVIASGIYCSSC